MSELAKVVSHKSGISEEQARVAIETTTNYLKANLPAPLAEQIEEVLRATAVPPERPVTGDLYKRLAQLAGTK